MPHLKGPVAASREGRHLWPPLWGHRAGKACGGGQEWLGHKLPIQPASSIKGRQGATGAGNRLGIGAVTATITQHPLCTCSDAQTLRGQRHPLSDRSESNLHTPYCRLLLQTWDIENPAWNKGHTSGLQCVDHLRAPTPQDPQRPSCAGGLIFTLGRG